MVNDIVPTEGQIEQTRQVGEMGAGTTQEIGGSGRGGCRRHATGTQAEDGRMAQGSECSLWRSRVKHSVVRNKLEKAALEEATIVGNNFRPAMVVHQQLRNEDWRNSRNPESL